MARLAFTRADQNPSRFFTKQHQRPDFVAAFYWESHDFANSNDRASQRAAKRASQLGLRQNLRRETAWDWPRAPQRAQRNRETAPSRGNSAPAMFQARQTAPI